MAAPSSTVGELAARFALPVGFLQVHASSPWLMEAAREELGSDGGQPTGHRFHLSLSHHTPGPPPPSPLRPGALLDGYLSHRSHLWLRGPGGAEFYADGEEACAHVFLPEALRGEAERVLGAGLPLLLAHLLRARGFWTVHAAAVTWEGRAVLIPGVSGSGKSTTAALLASHPAFSLVADDRVLLRGPEPLVIGLPGRSRLRIPASLWLDAAECRAQSREWLPGLLLFPSVAPDGPSRCTPVRPMAALQRLLGCSVAPGPEAAVERHLGAVASLARSLPAWHLQLGEDWNSVPDLLVACLSGVSGD